ncbi:SDR family oxidoreductase [Flavobacteriaceae bacterium 14752]|uniref:SDR family oxidoreductase n=1 Tax=Mesohalobacter salilacus TaxID=2491711 RepID=UPI000F6450DE|nr:SDR family oxidoreductase [Flavobacteriaceae bacterium 14752]
MVKNSKHWAIIIGGSQGLGLATAKQLAQDGYNLLIIHRDFRTNLPQIQSEFKAIENSGVQVLSFNKDALKQENIQQVFDVISAQKLQIKILVHSLAKGNLKLLSGDNAITTSDYMQTIHAMGVNFYEWAKALVDSKCYVPNTKLLAFTSEGNQKVSKSYAAVSAAKVTLEAVMRQMAVEFAPLGITSNCIQAGMTDTQSFQKIPNAEQLKQFNLKRNPFQRLTTLDDVAQAVSLLVDDKANWINGCVIPVDGGERLR